MRKDILLPAVALAGGAVGFGLRRWELVTAFEPDTGLPISGMPATWALIILSVAMAAAFLLLGWGKYDSLSGENQERAFAATGNTLYAMAVALSAFLLLAAAGLMLYSFFKGEARLATRLILAFMCVVSFGCLLSTARDNLRGEKAKYNFALLLPAYTSCIWLVSAYQVRAGDPIQSDYIYELFAIIAVLLGLYFNAGFSFGRGKPVPACLFSLLGAYLSIVTLADGHSLGITLLYVFAVVYLLSSTAVMLHNNSAAQPGGKRLLQPGKQPAHKEETESELVSESETEETHNES